MTYLTYFVLERSTATDRKPKQWRRSANLAREGLPPCEAFDQPIVPDNVPLHCRVEKEAPRQVETRDAGNPAPELIVARGIPLLGAVPEERTVGPRRENRQTRRTAAPKCEGAVDETEKGERKNDSYSCVLTHMPTVLRPSFVDDSEESDA